jgi:hypothetical protein
MPTVEQLDRLGQALEGWQAQNVELYICLTIALPDEVSASAIHCLPAPLVYFAFLQLRASDKENANISNLICGKQS